MTAEDPELVRLASAVLANAFSLAHRFLDVSIVDARRQKGHTRGRASIASGRGSILPAVENNSNITSHGDQSMQ